ncbi:MAG: cell division protein FtsQ [Cyclobacteriaceae bacterium]|nr:cell division protein FtsQ [Cyclobacteriaceae bacterium]
MKPVKYLAVALILILVIGFSNKKQSDRYVLDVVVNIDNQFENYFIDQSDVFDLIHETGKTHLLNLDLSQLDLRAIEKRIEAHRFISNAEVYHDLDGLLTIDIKQNRPLARILNPNGSDKYISTTGLILPESSHYTARVPLISLSKKIAYSNENINETEEGHRLFEFLTFIENDQFWKAQVASMDINAKYELTIHPQVTKQTVLFGTADNYQDKFKRLKIFYKEILPSNGWNSYSEVNLKYKEQIVCK